MKGQYLLICVVGVVGALFGDFDAEDAEAATNSWSSTSSFTSKWETPGGWSLGQAPSITHNAILITNLSQFGFKTILIDATTAASAPLTMNVSNLVLSGVGNQTNNLALENSGAVLPLRVQDYFGVLPGGLLSMTNSAMIVIGLKTNQPFVIDSRVELHGGARLQAVQTPTNFHAFAEGVGVNGVGSLLVAGGTNVVGVDGLVLGYKTGSTGSVLITDGQIVVTNTLDSFIASISIGIYSGVGSFTQSNGMVNTLGESLGDGTLTVAGGMHLVQTSFFTGDELNKTSFVWVTGGELVATGTFFLAAGAPASLTVTNGSVLTSSTFMGGPFGPGGAHGTLTIAGGTYRGSLTVSEDTASTCTVWVTGGQLFATNNLSGIFIATESFTPGVGSFNQSNGVVRTFREFVGLSGDGSLTIAGGTHIVGPQGLAVGFLPGSEGVMKVSGGFCNVHSNMTVGNCPSNALGTVFVQGGSLFVTNTAATAALDIRHGWVLLTAGQLTVDKLVITNECGHFFHGGGILSFGSLELDPNFDADEDGLPNGWEQTNGLDPLETTGDDGGDGDPDGDGFTNLEEYQSGSDPTNLNSSPLRITAIAAEDNNVRITWITGGGLTNFVQATNGAGNGSYSNNFTDIAGPIIVPGFGLVSTNYLDSGGATNKPSRYYRVRLVP